MGRPNTDASDITVYVTDDASQKEICCSMSPNATIRHVKLQIAMKNIVRDASESKVVMVSNPGDCYELIQNGRKLANDTKIKGVSQNNQMFLVLHVIVLAETPTQG